MGQVQIRGAGGAGGSRAAAVARRGREDGGARLAPGGRPGGGGAPAGDGGHSGPHPGRGGGAGAADRGIGRRAAAGTGLGALLQRLHRGAGGLLPFLPDRAGGRRERRGAGGDPDVKIVII